MKTFQSQDHPLSAKLSKPLHIHSSNKKQSSVYLKLPKIQKLQSDRILTSEIQEQFRDKFSVYSKPKSRGRNHRSENLKTEILFQTQRGRVDGGATESTTEICLKESKLGISEVFSIDKATTFRNSCSISRKVKELLNIKISALHSLSNKINSRSLKKLYKSSDQLIKSEKKASNMLVKQKEDAIRQSRFERERIKWLIKEDIIKESCQYKETPRNSEVEVGVGMRMGTEVQAQVQMVEDSQDNKRGMSELKKHKKVSLSKKKYGKTKRSLETEVRGNGNVKEKEKTLNQNQKWRANFRIKQEAQDIAGWQIEEI